MIKRNWVENTILGIIVFNIFVLAYVFLIPLSLSGYKLINLPLHKHFYRFNYKAGLNNKLFNLII